ncbi:MAG: oligosaccharide flippase family protein [Thermoprotei archaeon]|nr:oligosaccharide flippase family protein [Thermoprotei archaeon]
MSSVGDRVLRGATLLTLGSIVSLLLASIGSIVIARTLGPENYGLISVSMVIPTLLIALSDLGFGTALTRYSSMKDPRKTTYVYTGLAFKTVIAVLASATLLILAPQMAALLGRPEVEGYLRLLSAFVLMEVLGSTVNSIAIGLGLYAFASLFQIVLTAIRIVVAVVLVLAGFGVWGALMGHVVAWSIMTVTGLIIVLKAIGEFSRPSLNALRELLSYSLPLYFPTLIAIPLSQLYYMLMVRVSSNWEIGNLGVANNIMAPLGAVGGAITASLISSLPMILSSPQDLRVAAREGALYTSLIMPALAGGVIVVSQPLIIILYGGEYSMSPVYTSIMALGIFLAPLGSYIIGPYMASIGATRTLMRVEILGAIVSLPTYVILVLNMGVMGYIVAGLVTGLVKIVYALKIMGDMGVPVGVRENIKMIAPTVIALTTATPLILAPINIIFKWTLTPMVYAGTLALLIPLLVGEERLAMIARTLSKAGILGILIAFFINMDIKVAAKIWGLREEREG